MHREWLSGASLAFLISNAPWLSSEREVPAEGSIRRSPRRMQCSTWAMGRVDRDILSRTQAVNARGAKASREYVGCTRNRRGDKAPCSSPMLSASTHEKFNRVKSAGKLAGIGPLTSRGEPLSKSLRTREISRTRHEYESRENDMRKGTTNEPTRRRKSHRTSPIRHIALEPPGQH